MTAFLLIATAMLALALFFVLPALLYHKSGSTAAPGQQRQREALNLDVLRDQLRELELDVQEGTINASGYQSARQELTQRVAEEVKSAAPRLQALSPQRRTALALALALPLAAGSLYAVLGTPGALDPAQTAAAHEPMPPALVATPTEGMANALAEKLKASPDDAQGWRQLARAYETLQRFDQAVQAYQQVLQLTPDNADVLADYAVTLAMSLNQNLSGEPEKLINRALEIDPDHVQALALLGSAAFERKEYAKAVKPWGKILERLPQDSDMARSIAANIAKAQALAKASSGS